MIGRIISHYKILSTLGEGGMGVVYKAEDTKLKRTVALKFLHAEFTRNADAKNRFIHEARAAASLNHPHICTIHEIDEYDGQSFIAMEFVEGEGLKDRIQRGPLPLDDLFSLTVQIGEGLREAHEKGIVHRDIKPGNIMVTTKGQAKILDFGLARLGTHTKITKADTTLGTAAYMSPEQASGKEVDGRSDIWSLGVVLYEMVTGARPFVGEYEPAVVYSILHDEPEPLTSRRSRLPVELERIVGKALAKNVSERYPHVEDMLVDLRALRSATQSRGATQLKKGASSIHGARAVPHRGAWGRRVWVGLGVVVVAVVVGVFMGRRYLPEPREKPITSIAVLPFQNLSADPGQEYFSDGMTEAIIKELSQIKALRVISRTSVMRYKSTEKLVPEIARELGVEAVVEGSVLRADHDVRITAQLIAARPEKHLWADDFTRSLENILALQSDVAQAIAREIKVVVTPSEQERITRVRAVNPEAHEAYLKGRYFIVKSTPDDWYKAVEYFQLAVDVDSTYALAYAGMGEAYDRLASSGIEPPREAWARVKAHGEKALAIDSTLAEGILLIADAKYSYDWDVKGAEEYYKRAIEINPNLAMAHFWYGWFLATQGRFGDGIAELKRGVSLDPLWPRIMYAVSNAYEMAGEYDSALVYLNRIAEIDSSDSHIYAGKPGILLRQGKYAEAIEEAEKGVALGITPCLEYIAVAYALSGQPDKAQQSLARFFEEQGDSYYSPLRVAEIYCALGDREKVFEYLEKGYQERDAALIMHALVPPWCNFIKSDDRYHDLMRRMGIEN